MLSFAIYNIFMKRSFAFFLLITLFSCSGKDLFPEYRKAIAQYDPYNEIEKDIHGIMNENTSGRLPGTRAFDIAADYVAFEFQQSGLTKPYFLDNYFQYFSFENGVLSANASLSIGATKLEAGKDFVVCLSSGGTVLKNAPLAFAGYGLSEPGTRFNDYLYTNVTGRVVLMFKELPAEFLIKYPRYSNDAYRAYIAKNHGALGVIFIDTSSYNANESKNSAYVPDLVNIDNFPQMIIGGRTLGKLLEDEGIDLLAAKEDIDRSKDPYPIDLRSKITLSVPIVRKTHRTMNILGYIPADRDVSMPRNIIFAANLDSLGTQGEESYEGAVYNGSGVITLLNLARLFTGFREKGYRANIWFVAFSATEEGFKGGYELYDTLEFDGNNTDIFINIEGTGATDNVFEIGGGLDHPALFEDLNNANDDFGLGLDLAVSRGSYGEGQIFAAAGIPSLYVYGKSEKNKNTVVDTPDKIHKEGISNITKLLFAAFREKIYK